MSFLPSILLFGLAVLVGLGTGIWLLVLAFQKRIWWGLAVLFVPLANLAFVVVEWKASKRPFLLSLLVLPLCAGAWVAMPKDHPFMQEFRRQLQAPAAVQGQAEPADVEPNAPAASALSEITDRLAALQGKEAALLARKKALNPADKAAALALSHEIVAYNAELRDALATRDRLAQSAPAR